MQEFLGDEKAQESLLDKSKGNIFFTV